MQPELANAVIYTYLKYLRVEKRYQQKDLAAFFDIGADMLARVEQNRTKTIALNLAARACALFGSPIAAPSPPRSSEDWERGRSLYLMTAQERRFRPVGSPRSFNPLPTTVPVGFAAFQLQRIREEQGWSKSELSKALEQQGYPLTPQALTERERVERERRREYDRATEPSPALLRYELLEGLCAVFECELCDLVTYHAPEVWRSLPPRCRS